MGKVERAERRLTAEEIYGLAWALETSVGALMKPTDDDKHVEFPSGASLAAVSVQRSVAGGNDGGVRWSGDEPVFPGPAMTHAESRTWLEGLGEDARAQFDEIRSVVRAQEHETGPERPGAAS